MRELATTLTEALLDPILAREPSAPRITHYDDATGARIELSGLTLANWAAKTANFVRDEFGLTPGARIAVLLPAHWQTAAVLLGAWWAGAEVVLHADPDAELALVTPDGLDAVTDVPEVAVLSLDAFGRPVPDLPIGVTDYASSVRVHGDQFHPGGAGLALDGATVAEVLAAAKASAAEQGFAPGDRVLSTAQWSTPSDLIAGLLSVFVIGGSLVQVTNEDPATRERRIETERVASLRG